jgi:hypothetical protein
MPVNTRTSNADAHPGLVDRRQQTRRSRQEIEEDGARAESAGHSARKKAEAKHKATIELIAMTEDAIEREEQDVSRYSTRPDLRHNPKTLAEPVDSETEDDSG